MGKVRTEWCFILKIVKTENGQKIAFYHNVYFAVLLGVVRWSSHWFPFNKAGREDFLVMIAHSQSSINQDSKNRKALGGTLSFITDGIYFFRQLNI